MSNKKTISPDPLFEEFVRKSVVEYPNGGIVDAARMLYYGRQYKRLFTPVVTVPRKEPPSPHVMQPVHQLGEIGQALNIVKTFAVGHPGRGARIRDGLHPTEDN